MSANHSVISCFNQVKNGGAVNRIITWLTEYTQRGVESSGTRRAAFRSQLQLILGSPAFRNTEVLKRLLEYLGQQALSEEDRELKEYTVGIEAFGKPPDYDPKTDSSVRVLVGKLRQKLDEYYRTQGLNDSVLVQLPKGHFRLEFQERSAFTDPPPNTRRTRRPVLPWIVAGVALVWALAATFATFGSKGQEAGSERYSSPDIATLWSPFFESRRSTIISLGTPLFAKISGEFLSKPRFEQRKEFRYVRRIERYRKTAWQPSHSRLSIYRYRRGIGGF